MGLIDADTLKEHKYHSNEDGTPVEFTAWKQGWNDAIDAITNYAPTVDAVEVVRCKDCKFHLNSNEKCGLVDTRLHFYETDKVWTEDCFCAWGERREDDSK